VLRCCREEVRERNETHRAEGIELKEFKEESDEEQRRELRVRSCNIATKEKELSYSRAQE
jgi:hypothetical protein